VGNRPFTVDEGAVRSLLDRGDLAPSGTACLHRAWKGRDVVLA
jgi:hypothetical protein